MIADPVRLSPATGSTAAPADGGPPLDAEAAAPIPGQTSFDEVLRALNPLHHLPVVGTLYRAITGEQIQPAFRVLGGALFGGFAGMLTSAALAAAEEFRPAERLAMAWRGEPDPFLDNGTPSPAMLARARDSYAGIAYTNDHG